MVQMPPPCPQNWEYEEVANWDKHLTTMNRRFLVILRESNPDWKGQVAADTRSVHQHFFRGLAPTGFAYFAGNYRGEPRLRCLDQYEVGVAGDPRVGHRAAVVPSHMKALSDDAIKAFQELDVCHNVPNAVFSPARKLFRTIEIAAAMFVYFLEIHPYANGNGHMARCIVQALLARYGHYLNADFEAHPRPKEPAYSSAIVSYRNGDKQPLHLLLLACI